jgi:cytochrome c-type biogenesis protein CcmH/NrfF
MITAEVSIARDGENYGRLYPARWFYDKRPDEPTTEVAIRRGFAEDLYIVLAGYDASDQSAILMVQVNPLLNWIWVGIGIMILGTGIALLPERAFAFATSKVPEGAVTTSLILLMVLVAGVGRAHAQHAADPDVVIVPATTRLEKELQHQIVCMCGTCGRQRIGECTCPRAAEQRKELAALVAAGNTYDQIIDHFVTEWGSQQVLAAPIDEGFNRLAWALPYMVGLLGPGGRIGRGSIRPAVARGQGEVRKSSRVRQPFGSPGRALKRRRSPSRCRSHGPAREDHLLHLRKGGGRLPALQHPEERRALPDLPRPRAGHPAAPRSRLRPGP